MTDLLVRPTDRASSDDPSRRRSDGRVPGGASRARWPIAAGVLAAASALAVGLVVVEFLVTVLGLADGRSEARIDQALHVGAGIWLLAHGAALQVAEGEVTLVPLGITALAAVLLQRGGRAVAWRVAGRRRRAIPAVAAAVAVPYAVLALALALVVGGSGQVVPSAWRSLLGALVLGFVASGAGAATVLAPDRLAFLRRGARVLKFSGPRPTPVRVVVRAGLVATGALLAAAALVAATAIAVNLPTAGEVARDTEGGVVSATGVLVVQLALLPNLAVWFVAYLTGPGFAVGSDTVVRLVDGHLGEVPALPMFGGLPGQLPIPLVVLAAAVPVLAGVLAGRVVAGQLAEIGRAGTEPSTGRATWRLAGWAAAVGPVAGLLAGLASLLASGRVLGGGLADVGADALVVAAAVTLEVGLVATLTALALAGLRRRRTTKAPQRTDTPGVGSSPAGGPGGPGDGAGAHRRTVGSRRPVLARLLGPVRAVGHRLGRLRPSDGLAAKLRRPSWARRRRKVVRLPD